MFFIVAAGLHNMSFMQQKALQEVQASLANASAISPKWDVNNIAFVFFA